MTVHCFKAPSAVFDSRCEPEPAISPAVDVM